MNKIRTAAVLIPGIFLLAACTGASSRIRVSERYYEQANYYQAFHQAEEAKLEFPDDREVQRQYWKTRIAYLLERGQEMVFLDQDAEAVGEFEKVLVLDPENRIATRWIAKAKDKLARAAALKGREALSEEDLEGALLAFNEALATVPNLPDALEGLKQVENVWTRLRARAYDSYLEGVRALAERLFAQTEYRMLIALRNDPGLESAKAPKRLAQERLAEQRYVQAQALEKGRRFGAALKDYEDVAQMFPDLPGLAQRIEAMRTEVEVEALMRRAEMHILRDQPDEADGLLQQAFDKTTNSKTEVSELMLLARERWFDRRYRKAKDLELMNNYAGALVAYQKIQEGWPDYQDVAARISGLESAIELATTAYDSAREAEQKGELQAAIDQYSDALLYHPGFRDCEQRIRELRARLQSDG